jgi:predicted unusual protein kinase regulating ubiquinone biosynthesis (AarF/ABC1/UbiB family)
MATQFDRTSRFPSTRIGRVARLGMAATELAVGGVTEGVRNFGRSSPNTPVNMFLTVGNANKLARRLASMRGAAMKMGQMLSLESADILPRQFSEALADSCNAGNTMPYTQLKRVLEQEYGKEWKSRFEHFDYQPIATTSIGQVHRATTRDGRNLALKIQYPGVANSIDSDVDNMATLLRISKILPSGFAASRFVADTKQQLHREADYTMEADYLNLYGNLLKGHQIFVVPDVHNDFSRTRILAMDYLDGVPLESIVDSDVGQKVRDDLGRELLQLVFRELFEFRTMRSDPNCANYLYQPLEGRIALLDFGATVTFDKVFTDSYGSFCAAIIDGDRTSARHYAQQLGYLSPEGSDDYAVHLMEIINLIFEPIHTSGVYDFGSSDLFMGGAQDHVIPSPPANILHRKLMGVFLLSARLGARVNVQELVRPYLRA